MNFNLNSKLLIKTEKKFKEKEIWFRASVINLVNTNEMIENKQ